MAAPTPAPAGLVLLLAAVLVGPVVGANTGGAAAATEAAQACADLGSMPERLHFIVLVGEAANLSGDNLIVRNHHNNRTVLKGLSIRKTEKYWIISMSQIAKASLPV